MDFWSGIGNTILFVGLANCLFVFAVSLLLPELGPSAASRSLAERIPAERWLLYAVIAFSVAVVVELARPWLNANLFGFLRVALTFVGLAIVFVFLIRASSRLQQRFRR